MGKSDALSHCSDHGSRSSDNSNMILLHPELFAVCALKGLTLVGEECGIVGDIREAFSKEVVEDKVAVAVRKLWESGGKSLVSSEWAETNGLLMFRGKIYVPDVKHLWQQIVGQHHDTWITGHPGCWKTLKLVTCNYWWPHMSCYIGEYTKTCDLCLQTNVQRQPPIGEPHPLQVPEVHWDTLSVDFIVELPEAHSFDAVMNVINSVLKCTHFIPTNTTITSAGATCLFLHHVWKLHGLPWVVVLDRGVQFVREFTRELYRFLGICIAASTASHLQMDGQTECVNQ